MRCVHHLRAMAVLVLVAVMTLASGVTAADQGFDLPPPPPSNYSQLKMTSVNDFFTLWERDISLSRYFSPNATQYPAGTAKTILVPIDEALRALAPPNAPNPLYAQEEKYVRLRTAFLKEYMMDTAITPFAPPLDNPNGYTVRNLNGKPLTFKRVSGALSVNGLPISQHASLDPCTHVYAISSTLFDHVAIARQVFDEMMQAQQNRQPGAVSAPGSAPPYADSSASAIVPGSAPGLAPIYQPAPVYGP